MHQLRQSQLQSQSLATAGTLAASWPRAPSSPAANQDQKESAAAAAAAAKTPAGPQAVEQLAASEWQSPAGSLQDVRDRLDLAEKFISLTTSKVSSSR